jgi:hypothetical protein
MVGIRARTAFPVSRATPARNRAPAHRSWASTLGVVQPHCPRCGAELTADATECPTCAYGDVEDIVFVEAQPTGAREYGGPPRETQRPAPVNPSPLPRVLAALAILIVVIVAIFAVLR